MEFNRDSFDDDFLRRLFRELLLPRMIEEKMLLLLRQGRISKWFSGIGQEAISVGVVMALERDEYICPLHRNLGVFTGRDIPLERLFAQWRGTAGGFTQGRERSFHFGSQEHHLVGMISHLGPQNGVADGIALGSILKKDNKVTVVFNGDGGTSEGDFHEAMNLAAVWDLPVIFLIENNGYALSTPVNEQYRCKALVDKAIGYGVKGLRIDGNNVLEVYSTIKRLAASMRKKPAPVLLECVTFRMRGHEEASGIKYVPPELFSEWEQRDPVKTFEKYLLESKAIDESFLLDLRKELGDGINTALSKAFAEKMPVPAAKKEYDDLFAPHHPKPVSPPRKSKSVEMRLIDAVRDGMYTSMQRFDNLVIMGQDVAEYGGVFKATEGFSETFGKERVRNTPLCEAAVLGAALGLSIQGFKSVVEMQFADFVTEGFNQIVNNLAKIHWRWGQHADVVIRMPTGAGTGAGPFHSQSTESWFFHVPGLKIVYPSNAHDAKGLLCAAIDDPNPVMFFEHKYLYRSAKGDVPTAYYTTPIGSAKLVAEGKDLSIITYGLAVQWALEEIAASGLSADVLDLRTLMPLDTDAILATVRKTNRVLVLHEDNLTGGIGAEISAWISEHCFKDLDAPVSRLAGLDTPVPFAAPLEEHFLPKERLRKYIKAVLEF